MKMLAVVALVVIAAPVILLFAAFSPLLSFAHADGTEGVRL